MCFLVQKSTVGRRFLKNASAIPLSVGTPHRQKPRFLKRRVDCFLYYFGPMCAFQLPDAFPGANVSGETQISENYIALLVLEALEAHPSQF